MLEVEALLSKHQGLLLEVQHLAEVIIVLMGILEIMVPLRRHMELRCLLSCALRDDVVSLKSFHHPHHHLLGIRHLGHHHLKHILLGMDHRSDLVWLDIRQCQ